MRVSTVLILGVLLAGVATTAGAAVLTVTNDPARYPNSATFDDVASGPTGPVTRFEGTPAEVALSAENGLFGLGAGTLSTAANRDAITFTFARPVLGFGVDGRIADISGAAIDYRWRFEVGGDSVVIPDAADDPRTSAAFAGVVSDEPFTRAVLGLEVAAGASSAPFIELDGVATVVPVPAAAPLLATGLVAIAAWRHRSRRAR
jgi:opacity protein-like surface antigen